MIEVEAVNFAGARRFRWEAEDAGDRKRDYAWTQQPPRAPVRDPLALDLLEIGKAVHLTDLTVRRDLRLGRRTRCFHVRVPVSQPALWRAQREELAALAGFASCDAWRFEFTRVNRPPVAENPRERDEKCDVVALFSGGLDSLCGAAWLRQTGARPVFVSHSPPGRDRNSGLLTSLWQDRGGEPLPADRIVTFRLAPDHRDAAGKRSRFPETTRRTRPFFFLALAAAVALDRRIETIQMSENGAMALSLPLRAEAYGAFRARQAHDNLTCGFTRLLRAVVPGKAWTVKNPFLDQTKGEACALLAHDAPLAGKTVSCEYAGRQRARILAWKKAEPERARALRIGAGPQCGLCEPCISRRAALRAAGLPDPDRQYFFNLRLLGRLGHNPACLEPDETFPPLYGVVAPHAFWMERFCTRIGQMNYFQFGINYAPELARSAPGMSWQQKHALLTRYSDEILCFLHGSAR